MRRIINTAIAGVAAALLVGAPTAAATSTAGPSADTTAAQAAPVYHREQAVFGARCLTGTALGEVKLPVCGLVSGTLADFNQQWDWISTDGWWRLKNRHHGTCLSIGSTGPDVQMCNATHLRQQWRFVNGKLANRWSDGCLDWFAEAGRLRMGNCADSTNWVDDVLGD
ncbi:MAG TPA: RICIN domain-containing protein [Actinokineospora sp.]|nr:RICIN domain-containing protein [Actinokineospora sp.]